MDSVQRFYAPTRAVWRAWLEQFHETEQSVWLVFDKGADARSRLSYDDIVEEALCFGWIDSIQKRIDDVQAMLYVSKRKPRSAWAKTNKARVEKLLANNQMRPAGLAIIKVAQANGSWDALNKSDNLEQPPELIAELNANPKAAQFYDSMPPSSHKIILEWIYSARTEETRRKRIAETVTLAAQGVKAHHYRQ